jgi:Zn-dependent peptidase ImmA (M78 family)
MSEMLQKIKFIPYQRTERRAMEILYEAEKIGIYTKGEAVDIMLICEKIYNLKISYEPLDKKMQEGILGCLDFEQNAIFLDENTWDDNEGRLHFTIAHEMGHFVQHKPLYEAVGSDLLLLHNELDPIYEKPRRDIETQADMFASAILMPKDILIEKWQELGSMHFQEKARYLQHFFNVSREAMEYRIDNIFNKQKI